MTPLHKWAQVKSLMRDAQVAILEENGLTWATLSELEQEAITKMGTAEYLDTEWGRVQVKPEGPVAWVARRSTDVKLKPTMRLTLLNKQEREK